jgi:hypothetical protein
MLVLNRKPGGKMVSDDAIRDTDMKNRTTRRRRSEKARRQPDHRENDRLRFAAMKLLQSSGYSALRRLTCEATEAVIAVHGVLPSYYLKQIAQSAIHRLEAIRGVTNLVEVQATHSA